MSSPLLPAPDTPPQGRKIAPLPRRFRHTTSPQSAQDVLRTNGTPSQHSSSDINQSPSVGPSRRHSSQSSDNTETSRHLSPPAIGVSSAAFQFGQIGNSPPLAERQDAFTFRLLHNITPRPSPEPEAPRFTSSQASSIGLKDATLSTSLTQDREMPQPLHMEYSDEKIVVDTNSEFLDRSIPVRVKDLSNTRHDTHNASPLIPATPPSLNQLSNLSPSPNGLRPRSASDVSGISDINDSTTPYDVRDEETPLEPFFTPSFQTALQDGLRIANKVENAIEKLVGSSKPSNDLERLLTDARRLKTFQSSDTRTIAVLGDSGEGNCGPL